MQRLHPLLRRLQSPATTLRSVRYLAVVSGPQKPLKSRYNWIPDEAENIIARAYQRHQALAIRDAPAQVPKVSKEELESLNCVHHYEPKDWIDRAALATMRFMRKFTHAFFRKKYDHHAVVLETVAAVPGIVAAFHRHLRSLRNMKGDQGWINPLQEEAENERMHLLIWMYVTQPTIIERGLVMLAQFVYLISYSTMYAISGRCAHRLVGYLEEEAQLAYTDYLRAVDNGDIPNSPAPPFAIKYYRLPDDARIRDVIVHVRADECMHGHFNHMLADKYMAGDLDSPPHHMGHGDDSA